MARAKKSRPPRGNQAKVREIKINDFHENQPKTPINRAQIIDETVEDDFIVIVSNGKKMYSQILPRHCRQEVLAQKRRLALFNQSKKDELAAGLKRHKPNISFSPAIIGNEENTSDVMEMPLDNVVLSTPAVGMPPAVEPPPPILTVLSMKDWRNFNVKLYRKAV